MEAHWKVFRGLDLFMVEKGHSYEEASKVSAASRRSTIHDLQMHNNRKARTKIYLKCCHCIVDGLICLAGNAAGKALLVKAHPSIWT
jgi:hypothetical protein